MCIIGLKSGADIHFGCDSQINGTISHYSQTPKWIKFGRSILAVDGDPYIMAIIEMKAPFMGTDVLRTDVLAYTATLKTLLPPDINFTILLGGNSYLYRIESSYQITEILSYDAIGPGSEIAMGSLYSTNTPPESRIDTAIRASIAHKAQCGGSIQTDKI